MAGIMPAHAHVCTTKAQRYTRVMPPPASASTCLGGGSPLGSAGTPDTAAALDMIQGEMGMQRWYTLSHVMLLCGLHIWHGPISRREAGRLPRWLQAEQRTRC